MTNKNYISRTVRRSLVVVLMGEWLAFPGCATFEKNDENTEMDQSATPSTRRSINVYGEVPDEEYVIIQGANPIVVSARRRGVTDQLRVYVLWEEGLTVGDVLTRGSDGDDRFYLLNLIRDGERIHREGGGFEKLKGKKGAEWELMPGDVIELNFEVF